MKQLILDRIFNYFVNSSDFNGIPLRSLPEEFDLKTEGLIDIVKELVSEDKVSIQSSTNPHIIYSHHYPTQAQLKVLEEAKKIEIVTKKLGEITYNVPDTEYPICLYPSKKYLKSKRDINLIKEEPYTLQLALAEPQLKPIFFEVEVLDRYFNDPRYNFKFSDYSGSISCEYDREDEPLVREEDQIFLKTFGLGVDSNNNRVAVAFLRYLKDLTKEHQVYWKSREVKDECKMVRDYFENSIEGTWTSSISIFSAFIKQLNLLNEISNVIFGESIFRKNFDEENRPKEFTFFFIPTSKNFYEFILLLDKMISENINKKFFKGKIDLYEFKDIEEGIVERTQKGTLRLFEEWLISNFETDKEESLRKIFDPLKLIRNERRKPAHKIIENIYDKNYTEKQREIIQNAYHSIQLLSLIFLRHPNAQNYKLPDWVNNIKVKTY